MARWKWKHMGTPLILRIKEEFYACKKKDLDEMPIVNLNSCDNFKDNSDNLTWSKIMQDVRKNLNVALIRKHSYEYYGIAYECSKSYINKRTYENFFGALYVENSVEYIKLTADECMQMVKNKKCEMNKMIYEEKM